MSLFNHRISVKHRVANQCEKLLYALILTLVFEGIIRKLVPPLKTPVFFLKDILCVIGIILINNTILPKDMVRFKSIWITLCFLLLPLLFLTAWKDLVLAFFAAKQYLLYFITVIVAIVAFPSEKSESFKRFIFFCALMLVPTTIVAIMQNALPATHWLNLSVGGESLAAFSAGGKLRVGSTFSFTAQYSWFLVAESYLLISSYFMPPNFKSTLLTKLMPFAHLILIALLVISTFITGGRTAVLGCALTIAFGTVLIGIKRPAWFVAKGLPMFFLGLISLVTLRQLKPEFFAAYDARSAGTAQHSHNEEVADRVIGQFTDWTVWFWDQNTTSIFLGNGLGIMSNGSNQVSTYAARIREDFWTEGDVPTTFWEGGFYLGIVWYWFRFSMILLCFRLWRSLKNTELASAASVPFAYVIIEGINGTLAMQPPVAIWWWLSISIVFFIYRLENFRPVALTPFTVPALL